MQWTNLVICQFLSTQYPLLYHVLYHIVYWHYEKLITLHSDELPSVRFTHTSSNVQMSKAVLSGKHMLHSISICSVAISLTDNKCWRLPQTKTRYWWAADECCWHFYDTTEHDVLKLLTAQHHLLSYLTPVQKQHMIRESIQKVIYNTYIYLLQKEMTIEHTWKQRADRYWWWDQGLAEI